MGKLNVSAVRMARAVEDFAEHVVMCEGDRMWSLARPDYSTGRVAYSRFYAADVVVGRCGQISVSGDIAACVFAHHDRFDPKEAVCWIGRQHDLGYLREKAAIGLSDGGKLSGRVFATPRVVYAWAACRRLCELWGHTVWLPPVDKVL
jgi:hypothetical protein